MARALRLLGVWGLACAGGRGLDDEVALHQRLVDVPRLERSASGQGRAQPSAEQWQKAQTVVSMVVGKGIDRTLENLKLTSALGPMRWQILGALTQWAMDRYSRPKSAAHLECLDGIIDLFGKAFMSARDDEELLAQLADIDKIHRLARRFAEQTGAPQDVVKLIDVAQKAADANGGRVTIESLPKLVEAMAEPWRGQPLADMVLYATSVGRDHSAFDQAVLHKLLTRVQEQFHLPRVATTALEKALDSSGRPAPLDVHRLGEVFGRLSALAPH